MNINDQNSERSIRLLAAQRQAYSRAKLIYFFEILLSGPTIVIVSFLSVVFFDQVWISNFKILMSVLLFLFNNLVFDILIKNRALLGAKIQELFDCSLYGIEWNSIKCHEKPTEESIAEYYYIYSRKNDINKLENWYKIHSTGTENDIFRCQKINCWWDSKLRSRYNNFLIFLLFSLILLGILVSLVKELTVLSMFLQIIAPALPLLVLLLQRIISDKERQAKCQRLYDTIEKEINKEISDGSITVTARQFQNEIFEFRKGSKLIPNYFYRMFRNTYTEIISDLK